MMRAHASDRLTDAPPARRAAQRRRLMDRSYRALLRVPTLGRVLISMQIARVAQSMVSVAIVLFSLDRYGSPAFAGLVTFMSVFPGS